MTGEAPINRRIVDSTEALWLSPALLGGKASNLATLCRASMPVPPWICVTSEVFGPLTARISDLIATLEGIDVENRAGQRSAAKQISESIGAMQIADEDVAHLLRRFDQVFPQNAFVAVRSSAVGEDSSKDSFAGQMDTYLFVRRATLTSRVIACFASAFSERALLYRRIRGGDIRSVQAAVIVQLMVDARASGVMFTANPSTGSRDEIVIAAGYGLGEGVVGGLVENDTYFLEHANCALRECIVPEKRSRIVFDTSLGSGTRSDPVPAGLGSKRVLDDAQLAKVAALGRDVEALYGIPQDVEWAIDAANSIYLLQARPITTLVRGHETIFDNSNVVESFPGLSTPLTFSYARAGYFDTFRTALKHLGIAEDVLVRYASRHRNLVALLNGRIYYNLLNWYGMFEIGGLEWMLPAWERALGLPRRYAHVPRPTLRGGLAGQRVKLHLFWYLIRIQSYVDQFLERFQRAQTYYQKHDLSTLQAHALLDLHEYLALEIRGPYYVAVLNDAVTQQLFALLGKVIERFRLGDPNRLSNELLCGETGMESVEPVRSGFELARMIRSDPRLLALFNSPASADEVWTAIHAEAAFTGFRVALGGHLARYGDRTLHELKLETSPAEDNPEFVVSILRNYLRGGQTVEELERKERTIRNHAEEEVVHKLRGHPLRRWIFHSVLRRVREGIKNRENLRLARSRAFGWSKRIYRAMAHRFVENHLLDDALDIFYLTEEEIAGAVRGHAVTQELRSLTALRRGEYDVFRQRSLRGRVTTYGIVVGQSLAAAEQAPAAAEKQVMRGQGCSAGRVSAKAKVIIDPAGELDIDGEILVAPMTDPGWVFLMVASKGLVSEKGSLLSHTAIIGRELGIPTVVGVKNATELIASGQIIEIDGEAGTVRLVAVQSSVQSKDRQ
jgi:rifampicin phosphotransferase